MSINLRSELLQIDMIGRRLSEGAYVMNRSHYKVLLSNLDNRLSLLRVHINEGFSVITEAWRFEIAAYLKELIQLEVREYPQMEGIRQKICEINTKIYASTSISNKLPEPLFTIPPLKIGLFCDFDCVDNNGVIAMDFLRALENGVHSFTSASVLRFQHAGKADVHRQRKLDNFLLRNHNKIAVFRQNTLEKTNELFLFVVLEHLQGLSDEQILEALDLRVDGVLKRVGLGEIFIRSERQVTLDEFISFFSSRPIRRKIFLLTGHSSTGSADEALAGLVKEDYFKLRSFLISRAFPVLVISSCCAGGYLGLWNIRKNELLNSDCMRGPSKGTGLITLINSLGDYTTYLEKKLNDPLHREIDGVAKLLQGTKPLTLGSVKQCIREACREEYPSSSYLDEFTDEKEQQRRLRKRKRACLTPRNSNVTSLQVHFPQPVNTPGGFHALDENGGYSLTYVIAKQNEAIRRPIVIHDRLLLQLYPLVADTDIHFETCNPPLFSMSKGTSQHFVRSLTLTEEDGDFWDYIVKHVRFYKKDTLIDAYKAFFISKVHSGDSCYENIGMMITPATFRCTWMHEGENGRCYYSIQLSFNQLQKGDALDGKKDIISPFIHSLLIDRFLDESQPSDKTLREMSASMESCALVVDRLNEYHFTTSRVFNKLFKLGGKCSCEDMAIYNWVQTSLVLTGAEITELITKLLKEGRSQLVVTLIEKFDVDINARNYEGDTLLCMAITHEDFTVANHLLNDENLDINAKNSCGMSPLHLAVQLASEYFEFSLTHRRMSFQFLHRILRANNLDIFATDTLGWSALIYALESETLTRTLIEFNNGCLVNRLNQDDQMSLLAYCLAEKENASARLLLKADADVNIGNPSAIIQGIKSNDLTMIYRLLQHGAKPFQVDSHGCVPFIEAVRFASDKVIAMLLKRSDCDLDVVDREGLSAALVAMYVGGDEALQRLRGYSAPLPRKITDSVHKTLESLYMRWSKLNDFNSIYMFFTWPGGYSDCHQEVVRFLLDDNKVAILRKLIKKGLINLNFVDTQGCTPFYYICEKAIRFSLFKTLIKTCLSAGADPMWPLTRKTPLWVAMQANNTPLLSMLLHYTEFKRFETESEGHAFFEGIQRLWDLDLYILCIAKGAK